ncbi:hypothetical protein ACQP2F_06140 [Actinoplanes sp. CA-030573]|uniref:hypothetical protein n=1 Tax=Actinoplanes sp. CA-030573 TaxID=3239898 RepID=UPI003D928BE0
MRVFRTILGMLLLTIGLPSLLAGAALWTAMQHRDQGGAFSGDLQRLALPGYALVVPDVDRLLRADAPFTRIGDTQLRVNARTQEGPAFLGIAPTAAVQEYLGGVPYSTVRTVDIGTGALPVATNALPGRQAPARIPARASFWLRTGEGSIAWSPGDVTGGPYSLVVMSPGAKPGLQLTSSAELRPGWLNSSTWGLLTLGTLLVMTGLIVLAWPARRREVVYVVEPSQVPDLMAAIGAPLPRSGLPAAHPTGAHRPRTLADAPKPALPSAALKFTWPPAPQPALAGPTAVPVAAEPLSGVPLTAGVPVSAAPSSIAPSSAVPSSAAPSSAASFSAASSSAAPPSPAEYAAATAIPGRPVSPAGRVPAPGEPLNFIQASSAGGPVSLPLGDPPSSSESLFGRSGARGGKRQTPKPGDLPMFHASAVDAWVAETAAERARETEATAAARMAEVARRKAAAETTTSAGVADEDGPEGTSSSSPTSAPSGGRGPVGNQPLSSTDVAAAYAAGAADARAARAARGDHAATGDRVTRQGAPSPSPAASAARETASPSRETAPAARETAPARREPMADRDPRTAGQRVAVITGPKATDWAATGLTRADSPRVGRQASPAAGGSSRRPSPFPKVDGLGRPSVAAAERAPGDAELAPPVGKAGVSKASVQREEISPPTETSSAKTSAASGPDQALPATPAASAESPASATTASAGAAPLSASRARQAAGADTATAVDDRRPVSAPRLTSVIGASGAAPEGLTEDVTVPEDLPKDVTVPEDLTEDVTAPGEPKVLAPASLAAPRAPESPRDTRPADSAKPEETRPADSAKTGTPGRHAADKATGERVRPETPNPAPAAGEQATPTRTTAPAQSPSPERTSENASPVRVAAAGPDVSAVMHAMARGERIAGTAAPATTENTPADGRPAQRPMPKSSDAEGSGPRLATSIDGDVEREDAMAEVAKAEAARLGADPAATGSVTLKGGPRAGGAIEGFTSRLPGLGQGRPAPAAWRKAAETVAARAAEAAKAQTSPATNDSAESEPGEVGPAAGVTEPGLAVGGKPLKATRPRAARVAKPAITEASAEVAKKSPAKSAKATPAKVTPAKVTPAKAASAKAANSAPAAATGAPAAVTGAPAAATAAPAATTAAPAAATGASAPGTGKQGPKPAATAKPSTARTTRTTAAAKTPAAKPDAEKGAGNGSGGLTNYQKEAAELFAASAQRRRRRTVTNPIEPTAPEPIRRRRAAPNRPQDD